MKVETPQILWNNEADKGINAPLLSIDVIESGIANPNSSDFTRNQDNHGYSHVLVTAGNAASINLWKVCFGLHQQSQPDQESESEREHDSIFQKQTRPLFNKIDYMLSLDRHDATVNCVAFSPDGLHLATAGDSGSIIIWSVPVNKRGNNNGRHFWSTLTHEKDLVIRVVSTHCEGIVDLSWSADSKRFTVGTIDSCVLIYEDKQYGINACSPETHRKESDWQPVFRNADQHGSFVQGVAYDPLDVYIASMGGDRTVRIFPRKTPHKSKKKVLRPANRSTVVGTTSATVLVTPPPNDHRRMVAQILTESKIEVGKSKCIKSIKQRLVMVEDRGGSSSDDENNIAHSTGHPEQQPMKQTKHKLFVDESNCESFFRRLSWTVDGAFLVTPAALWHGNDETYGGEKATGPLFSTYLFARHQFEKPYRVLTGLDKPSVVVRPNPVLFELPPSVLEDSKENQLPLVRNGHAQSHFSPKQCNLPPASPSGLPYRSIFAVLTLDSILIYDTHHVAPLSVLQGLHYSGLTDCCWSSDGMNLTVCSSDGYISIINFARGELGKVYTTLTPGDSGALAPAGTPLGTVVAPLEKNAEIGSPIELPPLPPCDQDPSPTVLIGPAAKKAKKTRITPTLVSISYAPKSIPDRIVDSTAQVPSSKRAISETEIVGEAVTKLSLKNDYCETLVSNASDQNDVEVGTSLGEKPKKKKKRVQPLLISNTI